MGDDAGLALSAGGADEVGVEETSVGDGDGRFEDLGRDARGVQDFESAGVELRASEWRSVREDGSGERETYRSERNPSTSCFFRYFWSSLILPTPLHATERKRPSSVSISCASELESGGCCYLISFSSTFCSCSGAPPLPSVAFEHYSSDCADWRPSGRL